MKISPSSLEALRNAKDTSAAGDRSQAKAPTGTPAPTASGSERVDLSALAAQIAALESSLLAEPGFDRGRVDAIKQAIVDGKLSVDSGVVADKMLQSALALLKGPVQ